MMRMPKMVAASMPLSTVKPRWIRDWPRAGGDHQRHQANDEGQGGHQHGPEAHPGRQPGPSQEALAGLALLLGELDDKDGVLARQADEKHQADLGIEIVFQVDNQRPPAAPRTATVTEVSTEKGIAQLS